MKRALENAKYLMYVIVVASFVATGIALIWSVYETALVVINVFTNYKSAATTLVSFVQLMDIFLTVAVLYIFTVVLYELFIGDLELPGWLTIHNFDELKTILSNMVVLIAAVSFLKYFLERNDPLATLLYGAALTLVSLALILYRRHTREDTPSDPTHLEVH